MSHTSDRELREWMATWRAADAAAGGTPEAIRAHVRRRSRWLWIWLAAEVAVVVIIAPVLFTTAVNGDLVDKAAMLSLAVITAAALGFSWWNWRGAIRVSAESTSAFVALSALRTEKLARALRAGWVVLAAEVLVFIPWVAARLYARPSEPSLFTQLFGWGVLMVMTALGVWMLRWGARWVQAERDRLAALQDELEG